MRNFTKDSPITMCFEDRRSPLIKIDNDGKPHYYNTKREKLEALGHSKKTDKFYMVWVGQRSSDMFELNEDDIIIALTTY